MAESAPKLRKDGQPDGRANNKFPVRPKGANGAAGSLTAAAEAKGPPKTDVKPAEPKPTGPCPSCGQAKGGKYPCGACGEIVSPLTRPETDEAAKLYVQSVGVLGAMIAGVDYFSDPQMKPAIDRLNSAASTAAWVYRKYIPEHFALLALIGATGQALLPAVAIRKAKREHDAKKAAEAAMTPPRGDGPAVPPS